MIFRSYGLLLFFAVLAMLTGCATGGGGGGSSGGSRGTLSDATARSAGQEEPETRETERSRSRNEIFTPDSHDDYSDNDFQDYSTEDDSEDEGSWLSGLVWGLFTGGDDGGGFEEADDGNDEKIELTRHNLNLWYSRSHLAGDTIQGFSTWSLMYSGFGSPDFRGHVGAYGGRATLGYQPNIRDGIRRLSEYGLLLGGRKYITADNSFMGFYFLLGLNLGGMFWSYTNPIEAPSPDGGVEYISDDSIFVITPSVGLGTSLIQTRFVHLGASITTGVQFPTGKTGEGFENDLFQDMGEFKLNLEASIFF